MQVTVLLIGILTSPEIICKIEYMISLSVRERDHPGMICLDQIRDGISDLDPVLHWRLTWRNWIDDGGRKNRTKKKGVECYNQFA